MTENTSLRATLIVECSHELCIKVSIKSNNQSEARI
jgi:hypothetical protein